MMKAQAASGYASFNSAQPHKLFYQINEVARMTGVKPYVLRYWESEFPELSPEKSGSNQRRYRSKDILTVMAIRKLLYEDRFTIKGARRRLKDEIQVSGRKETARPPTEVSYVAEAEPEEELEIGAAAAPEPAKSSVAELVMESKEEEFEEAPPIAIAEPNPAKARAAAAMLGELGSLRREVMELMELLGERAPGVSWSESAE